MDLPVTPKGRQTRERLLKAGEKVAERDGLFAKLTEPSMRALALSPAPTAARLIVALTSEAALIEMEAGRKVPGARRTIGALLGNAAIVGAREEARPSGANAPRASQGPAAT